MEMVRRVTQILWDWKQPIIRLIVWYWGLIFCRDELEIGEIYLLLSGFWLIYLIGFSPRQPGELSAYSLFNENHQRILGDLDPGRAGRELTGQVLYDQSTSSNNDHERYLKSLAGTEKYEGGHVLGGGGQGQQIRDEDDADLQRALLLSLREEREARQRKQ
jgi:hypothetical protein